MDKLRPFKKKSVCLGMKRRVLPSMRVFNFTNIFFAQRIGARVCTHFFDKCVPPKSLFTNQISQQVQGLKLQILLNELHKKYT